MELGLELELGLVWWQGREWGCAWTGEEARLSHQSSKPHDRLIPTSGKRVPGSGCREGTHFMHGRRGSKDNKHKPPPTQKKTLTLPPAPPPPAPAAATSPSPPPPPAAELNSTDSDNSKDDGVQSSPAEANRTHPTEARAGEARGRLQGRGGARGVEKIQNVEQRKKKGGGEGCRRERFRVKRCILPGTCKKLGPAGVFELAY